MGHPHLMVSCTTAGTSGWAWLSLARPSHSTSVIFYGKAARDDGSRDWCQVLRYIMRNLFQLDDKLGIVSPTANEEVKQKHCTAIAQYFYHNQRRNSIYGARFVMCELFNVLNVALQVFLIDSLLGGEFSSYGLEVLQFTFLDDEERTDPIVKVFPKVTKCTFHNFGVSGTIQQ